jgi:hypothetical protein
MNWKGYGRKNSGENRGNIQALAWEVGKTTNNLSVVGVGTKLEHEVLIIITT